MLHPDAAHLAAVQTLTRAGFAPPAPWAALHNRYTEFFAMTRPMGARLAAAIISGEGDVPALRAAALAEETAKSTNVATVNNAVMAAVCDGLRAAYKPTAGRQYAAVAARFDQLAGKLTACVKQVNPDLSPDELLAVIGDTEKIRAAWYGAVDVGAALDSFEVVLRSAAYLVGAPAAVLSTVAREGVEYKLPLIADLGKGKHRPFFEAYEAGSCRAGRLAGLIKAGATVRACPNPERLKAYERPGKLLYRFESGGRPHTVIDPEDKAGREALAGAGAAEWG
jgi:hypothetical protein